MKHKKNLLLCLIAILAIFSIVSCGGNELPNVPDGNTDSVKEKLAVPEINFDFDTEAERTNAEAGKVVKFFTKTLADDSHPDVYFTTDPAIGENVTIETGTKQNFNKGMKLPNEKEVTYWAFSYKEGYESSDVVSFSFTINNKVLAFSDPDKTKALENVNPGTYGKNISVYLSTARAEEGKIWYTTDGSNPTEKTGTRKAYSEAILITAPEDHPSDPNLNEETTITLKAYFDDDTQPGKIETYEFVWKTTTSDLIFTRFADISNSNPKIKVRFIEITNISDKDVNLQNYIVNAALTSNGNKDPETKLKGILPAGKTVIVCDSNMKAADNNEFLETVPANVQEYIKANSRELITAETDTAKVLTNGAYIFMPSNAYLTEKRTISLDTNGECVDKLNLANYKEKYAIRHYSEKPTIADTWQIMKSFNASVPEKHNYAKMLTWEYGPNKPVEYINHYKLIDRTEDTVNVKLYVKNGGTVGNTYIYWVSSTKVTDESGLIVNNIQANGTSITLTYIDETTKVINADPTTTPLALKEGEKNITMNFSK